MSGEKSSFSMLKRLKRGGRRHRKSVLCVDGWTLWDTPAFSKRKFC